MSSLNVKFLVPGQILLAGRWEFYWQRALRILALQWFSQIGCDWKKQHVRKSIYWVSPRICSRTLMGYSRDDSLLPSGYADMRAPDDAIAF